MRFYACKNMGWFTPNNETEEEEDGEIEKMSWKLKQKLGDLECEEAILKDKNRFGRVRSSLMEYLRAKNGYDTANRALSRVNKRLQQNYFSSKTISDLYRHSSGLIK